MSEPQTKRLTEEEAWAEYDSRLTEEEAWAEYDSRLTAGNVSRWPTERACHISACQTRQGEIDELRAALKQSENVLLMLESVVLVYDPTVYQPIKEALAAARAVLGAGPRGRGLRGAGYSGGNRGGRLVTEQAEIRQLRRKLADAKANHEEAILVLKRSEAAAVIRDVSGDSGQDWKSLGPNEEARKYNTVLILEEDVDCKIARSDLKDAERTLAEAEADVEAHLLALRAQRVAATEKLADALLAGGLVAEVAS